MSGAAGEGKGPDVVAMVLKDHCSMEEPFPRMRSVEADREGAREKFAARFIAHGEGPGG
ncbi:MULTISPECIES: hypothetical protein [unclassified Streptomyces]|uniref:hypothetical protein n=1 Tax=unclassified Streptomyces TaxID=2593676 RepID=UPI002256D27D|nr:MULTISPECIES: hypothetical protein [unclassified Streptomyces]MCX4625167.1 hypothetical protein [Streptomyces sp. NBC_01443]MCX4633532.1 hypothetical protein [Streptomyces sp. NBC_01443]WSW49727.1 hypothetical protein OG296_42660 [Streptomyces sp. NBC_01001]